MMEEDSADDEARQMLEAFASVGATRFNVTWTNSAGHPRRPRALHHTLKSLAARCRKPETKTG